MLTLKDCYGLQDSHLDVAKKRLRKTKRLNPWAFIYTDAEDWNRTRGDSSVMPLSPQILDDGAPKSEACIIIDMAPLPALMTTYCKEIWPERAKQLDEVIQMGREMKVEDPHRTLLKSLARLGWEEKDITTAMVRTIATRVNAYCVVFVSEAWICKAMPKDRDQDMSVRDMPGSFEAIVSNLETRTHQRLVSIPVQRKPSHKGRDMGRVTGFGAPDIFEAKKDSGDSGMTGRMANWLKPLDA